MGLGTSFPDGNLLEAEQTGVEVLHDLNSVVKANTVGASVKLQIQAPTRIDLAGGALDIYPLYIFEGGGVTLNAAIDLVSQVDLRSRDEDGVAIEALDLNLVQEAGSIEELSLDGKHGGLELIIRILQFYAPQSNLSIRTRCNVPPGSGLGGSSSLLVALSSALIQWENSAVNKKRLIDYGAEIEAQSIRIPTGKQDYYPAAYGGFHALWLGIEGVRREPLQFSAPFKQALQTRLILGYCGASRMSAESNWSIVKSYIDRQPATLAALKQIRLTAERMYRSLIAEDLVEFGECLAEEWDNRRRLAEGVTTPRLDRIFAAAEGAGAIASKVCGAGGGGCFITFAREGRRQDVADAILTAGGEVLEYQFAAEGVSVVC